eukprot:gene10981-biopygen3251
MIVIALVTGRSGTEPYVHYSSGGGALGDLFRQLQEGGFCDPAADDIRTAL